MGPLRNELDGGDFNLWSRIRIGGFEDLQEFSRPDWVGAFPGHGTIFAITLRGTADPPITDLPVTPDFAFPSLAIRKMENITPDHRGFLGDRVRVGRAV